MYFGPSANKFLPLRFGMGKRKLTCRLHPSARDVGRRRQAARIWAVMWLQVSVYLCNSIEQCRHIAMRDGRSFTRLATPALQ